MKIFKSIHEWALFRDSIKGSLGFVPTMGGLHDGHLSLVRESIKQCDQTLVSVFLNPTQFNNPEDLETYPNDLQKDLDLLEKSGCDYVLLPTYEQLYPLNYRFKVTESHLSKELCGTHRPGHFDGVLTVVLKLLMVAQAQKAFFGEKDHQQYLLIKDLTKSFFLPVKIIACPTIRNSEGLALSSRNERLNNNQLKKAPLLYELLNKAKSDQEAQTFLEQNGFLVDYVKDKEHRRYAAVQLGDVRLIDNVPI